MNILVIAPMKVEYDNFKRALKEIPHYNTYKVINSGIGKVNAAQATALELYGSSEKAVSYDLIAVIGYCGATSHFNQGDFVIPRYCKCHDIVGPTDLLSDLQITYALSGNDNCSVLSGDTFVTQDNVQSILTKSPTQNCIFDMEASSVCQVAEDYPIIVLKLVSDIISNSNEQSFEEFVKSHSNFSQFIHYLESLS